MHCLGREAIHTYWDKLADPTLARKTSERDLSGARLADLRFPLDLCYRVLDGFRVEKLEGVESEHLLQLVGCQAERSR